MTGPYYPSRLRLVPATLPDHGRPQPRQVKWSRGGHLQQQTGCATGSRAGWTSGAHDRRGPTDGDRGKRQSAVEGGPTDGDHDRRRAVV